jgi:hypothetical protein
MATFGRGLPNKPFNSSPWFYRKYRTSARDLTSVSFIPADPDNSDNRAISDFAGWNFQKTAYVNATPTSSTSFFKRVGKQITGSALTGVAPTSTVNKKIDLGTPGTPAFRDLDNIPYTAGQTSTTIAVSSVAQQDGDIMIATMFCGHAGTGSAPTPTPPTGWTLIDSTNANDAGGFNGKMFVYWKRALGESGSWTWTTTSCSTALGIVAFSGCIQSGSPIDTYGKTQQDSGSTLSVASITTSVPNEMLVWTAHNWDNGGVAGPSGFSAVRYADIIWESDFLKTSAGATGAESTSSTGSATGNPSAAMLIALLPATGGIHTTTSAITNNIWSKIVAVASTTATTVSAIFQGGFQQFNKTITVASTTATSVVKQVGKIVSVASTSSIALTKRANKIVGVVSSSVTSSVKLVSKAVVVSSVTSSLTSRVANKFVSISSVTASLISRAVNKSVVAISSVTSSLISRVANKIVAVSSTSSTTIKKSIGKLIPISSVTATVVNAIRVFLKTITVASSSVVSLAKSTGKILAVNSVTATVVSMVKNLLKTITVAGSTVTGVIKSAGKSISAASITATTSNAIRVFLKTITVALTSSATVSKASSKLVAIVSSSVSSVTKTISKRITLASVSATLVAASKAFLRTITVTSTSSVALVKSAGKTIATSVSSTVIGVKQVLKKIAVSVLDIASVIAQRSNQAFLLTITVASTSSVSIFKMTGKTLGSIVVSTLAAISWIVSIIQNRFFKQTHSSVSRSSTLEQTSLTFPQAQRDSHVNQNAGTSNSSVLIGDTQRKNSIDVSSNSTSTSIKLNNTP